MLPEPPPEIGEVLAKWETGDREALRALFPLIYEDLRRLAHHHMRKERPDHTLQTTALVNTGWPYSNSRWRTMEVSKAQM